MVTVTKSEDELLLSVHFLSDNTAEALLLFAFRLDELRNNLFFSFGVSGGSGNSPIFWYEAERTQNGLYLNTSTQQKQTSKHQKRTADDMKT